MAKLSIIIPVYQVKPYLDRCLNSVLSQTFSDYEVILVDDGSTDGSQDICDVYAEKYDFVRVIHKQNGGLSSARNVGIESATGEYLMFVDSDDLIHSKATELQLALVEENNAETIICTFKRFNYDYEINIYSAIEKFESISVISGLEAEKGLFSNLNANIFVSSCGKVYKRTLFDGVRFPEGRLFEDEYTTYRLYYKCNKVVVVDTELYFYFVNKTGITHNLNLNKRFDEYDAQYERILFFKENEQKDLYYLALLEFLRTAQWDLVSCQKGKQNHDRNKGARFQSQYATVLKQAEKEKLVTFTNNYDYYILAFPKKKSLFRLKRLACKAARKMK